VTQGRAEEVKKENERESYPMNARLFWRDKLFLITIVLLTAAVGGFALWALNCPPLFTILISALYLLGGLTALLREYFLKKSHYKTIYMLLDSLEDAHYIADTAPQAQFWEGKIMRDILQTAAKSMHDTLAKQRKETQDYHAYIELWVHEIKTPISGAKLICERGNYGDVLAELRKVEHYVEQVLFYARSESVEKDYILREIDVKDLIAACVRENAKTLIAHKIQIEIQAAGIAIADPKWIAFILQQLIDNAIKYAAKTITFIYQNNTLRVKDDGIGIPARDLPRVFDRGFTGENGRNTAQSTGMGLYICKELCTKMGLEITAESDDGTTVAITFPKNPYIKLL
jgi:signal transduction histidine kinase